MIWLILILATILRLIKLDQSLWLDEAINVLATQNISFWGMVTKYPVGDFHPPGYFALLWIWTRIGGIGEIWVRMPSVIFGVVTVWIVYLLGKEFFDKKIAILAAFFLSIAPLHVYYSQEARMYSFAAFSVAFSFYFFWKVLNKGNMVNLVGYGISNAFVLYSDYLAYLIFPTQFIYLLLFKRNFLVKVIGVWILNLVILIPWLGVFSKQLATGTAVVSSVPGWANVVGGASVKELLLIPVKTFFGRVSIDDNRIYLAVAGSVGLIYGILIFHALNKLDKATKLLICWTTIPVILAFIISYFIPILSYFRMLFIFPSIYLLLARGVDRTSKASPWRYVIIAIIILVSLISLSAYYTNPKFQREDWKGAALKVGNLSGGSFLILFESNTVFAPFTYYSNSVYFAKPGLKKVPALSEKDLSNLDYEGKNNIFLFEYLFEITDPSRLLQKKIESLNFRKIDTYNFHGVGFLHHYQYRY